MCVLAALLVAGLLEGRLPKRSVAQLGGVGAIGGLRAADRCQRRDPQHERLFYIGCGAVGPGTGLSTVSNLSLMLDMTTADKVGLFMGAWGMANALSRLPARWWAGVLRDLVAQLTAAAR